METTKEKQWEILFSDNQWHKSGEGEEHWHRGNVEEIASEDEEYKYYIENLLQKWLWRKKK